MVGTAISAGTSLLGSAISASSSKNAGSAQADAANQAGQLSQQAYQNAQANEAPFLQNGQSAEGYLGYLLGLPGAENGNLQLDQTYTATSAPKIVIPPSMSGQTAQQVANNIASVTGVDPGTIGGYLKQGNGGLWYIDGSVGGNSGGQFLQNIFTQSQINSLSNAGYTPVGIGTTNGLALGNANAALQQNTSTGASGANGYGSLAAPFTLADFQEDPGYEFNLAQGQKALDRTAAAKGDYFSGAASKALQNYSQDYASNEFNNAYNRYTSNQTNLYNKLSGVAGTGQTAASTLGNLGANAATQQGNDLQGAAYYNAAGNVGSVNAYGTGLGAIGQGLTNAYNNYSTNALNQGASAGVNDILNYSSGF